MVLSLLVVFLVVVPFYLVGGRPHGATRGIVVVPTAGSLAQLEQRVPGVPVPRGLPAGWRPTSTTLDGDALRIGYVTPGNQYAEYSARSGASEEFLRDQTGQGRRVAQLKIGQRMFEVWTSDDGQHTSLVLRRPDWTVVVGGLRESAEDDELQNLAASLR